MKIIALTLAAAVAATTLPVAAEAGPRHRWDRIEDRIDRRESRIDERVDLGRRDVIEDRIDRWEDRLDYRGIEWTPRIDRHERRSWWRRWDR